MYHNTYPASLLLSNVHPKSPLILAYSDVPLLAVEHLATLTPYAQFPAIYASQFAFDGTGMKRVPINLLMQNVESINCYVPNWRRKDFNVPAERHYCKESTSDSVSTCDSSRSSTPSSGVACEESVDHSPKNSVRLSPYKRQRRDSDTNNTTNGHLVNQRHNSFNQRYLPQSSKNSSDLSSNQLLRYTLHGCDWNKLSQGIWRHFMENRQREEKFFQKMSLRDTVYGIFRHVFPYCSLHVVGSSVNGLGTNTSDMDVCLMISVSEIDQQTEALHILRFAQKIFDSCSFVKSTELITAKVPILKFTDRQYGVQVDFNINNRVGIWNTQLIRSYCCLDWRVQPLVLTIKKWAQDWDINNAKDMTLSSYSLVLMVIHYLQCGCWPPVVPCLHKMRPKRHLHDHQFKWFDQRDELPNFKSKNSESLGELLIGFFDYFSNSFNFERDVMSIRLGCKLPKHVAMNFKSLKNKRGHWKYICIEEPFNRTNTACAVYDADSFRRIFEAFKTAGLKLKVNKEISAVLKL